MHERVVLVDTVKFGNLTLVDFPVNENNGLHGSLCQKGTNNQKKQDSFHDAKINIFGVKLLTDINSFIEMETDYLRTKSQLFRLFLVNGFKRRIENNIYFHYTFH